MRASLTPTLKKKKVGQVILEAAAAVLATFRQFICSCSIFKENSKCMKIKCVEQNLGVVRRLSLIRWK